MAGLAIFFISAHNLNAQTVSREAAVKRAMELTENAFPDDWDGNRFNIKVKPAMKSDLPFYVCTVDNKGFVLVAKDKKCPPVLGFSYEGSFTTDKTPEIFDQYVELINRRCSAYISGRDTFKTVPRSREPVPDSYLKSQETLFVPPLLTTKWKIDSSFCAQFPAGSMSNASAVIAMGQVFRYYEKPESGIGEFCYLFGPERDELCTNFGYIFDYSQMMDTESNDQVSTLLYYLAMCGKLQPGGANLNTYIESLPGHFFYSDKMRKLEYWQHDFRPAIKYQLSMNRPVPAEWKGFSFVIDGYYDTDFFHFNFGKGGDMDGFYLLDFPKITTDRDYFLLSCFINYHPKSNMPAPENLNMTAVGDSLWVSWNINLPDTLENEIERFILLRDGVLPIMESENNNIMVHPSDLGVSSGINVVAVYRSHGASELSEQYRYISDYTLADIPSLELRQAINIQLGYTDDLNRIPYLGELEMVKKLEIDFDDQRGIDQLSQLRFLFVDGIAISGISDGEYLNSLNYVMFHRCKLFDYTVFESTENLTVIQGSDGLPYDFYDLRHNYNAGVIIFASHDAVQNNCMDLYGVDKYFQNLTTFDLYHITYLTIDTCFVSYETWNDVLPNIRGGAPAIEHTSPSSFAPCYPSPARNTNVPNTSQLSWQGNFDDEPDVFYNVYIGKTRDQLALVAPFYSDNVYDYEFENNLDYYWRVEAFHGDTTYYSGIYHFSTYEELPMPFEDDFDDYYAKADVSFESPYWTDFGDQFPEPAKTSRTIKRSGRYSLECNANSDAGILVGPEPDSAYQIDFYFRNNGAEFWIELLQGDSGMDSFVVNSGIGLFGTNLGTFEHGEGAEQFLFNADDWNHASIFIDLPSGLGKLIVNDQDISYWNWNKQKDGSTNTNAFHGIRFVNKGESGSGLIDDFMMDFAQSSGVAEIQNRNATISYSPLLNELIVNGNYSELEGLEIIDLRGRKITNFALNGEQRIQLEGNIPDGIYILRAKNRDGSFFSEKISILR